MINIGLLKGTIVKGINRGILLGRKYSPEILLGVGIISGGVGLVMTCKATLKAEEIINELTTTREKIDTVKELADNDKVTYDDKQYKEDKIRAYARAGVDLAKLYGPALSLELLSLGCILFSHGILKKRNLALFASYKALEEGFKAYRKRVRDEENGIEKDLYYKTGITKKIIKSDILNDKGEVVGEKEEAMVILPKGVSEYAKFFNSTNKNWSNVPEYNLTFLKMQQNFANDLLHSRGHVFLNEVYDLLGLERTTAGALCGWVEGHGDNEIDFGLYEGCGDYPDDYANDTIGERRQDFVNCIKVDSVLLDFNVDGPIYNLI